MNFSPAPKTGITLGGFLSSWKLLSILLVLLVIKFFSALEGYPTGWCDEIVYTEPAVNFVQTGHYAALGIAQQLAAKGLDGLERDYFLNVPLGTYARVAMYEVLGAGQTGRRLADWIFLVLATAALLFFLRAWVTPTAMLLAGIVFVLHRIVGDDFGRPDLFSLTFGLFALALVARPQPDDSAGKPLYRRAFAAGFLIGLSGFTHQFGGVFWAFVVVAVQLVMRGPSQPFWSTVKWMLLFGLSGLSVGLVWLPQILGAPQDWQHQFFYLLNLKQHLAKSFVKSAGTMAADTIGKNPLVCLMILASPFAICASRPWQKKLCRILVACLLLLLVWRCHSFEYYVRQYSIHFWAVICILFAFVFDAWTGWLEQKFSSARAAHLQNITIVAVILAGSLQMYLVSVEAFWLPFAESRKEILTLLQKNILPGERVLATDAFYYDVPTRNKSVWYWSEKLDLSRYNVLVAAYATPEAMPVSDGKDRDQWENAFSPEQAVYFMKNFELVAGIPEKRLSAAFAPPHYRPFVAGCYFYRNKHPRSDTDIAPAAVKTP